MFRNQYDQDMLTWSPQGRLHQVEYAMEAVKQGSTVVACGNQNCVVLAALKRKQSKLSSMQGKLFGVNERVGVAVSGLSTDSATLVKLLREESVREEFVFGRVASPSKLASLVSKSLQISTRESAGRPCGVGLVIVGSSEDTGCQILQTCPSGDVCQMWCTAIGARSQSARTHLEKHLDELKVATVNKVIHIALRALSESNVDSEELTSEACELATVESNLYVSKSPEEVQVYLDQL